MGTAFWSVRAIAIVVLVSSCYYYVSAFDFFAETSVHSWSQQFQDLSAEEQQILDTRIRSSVFDTVLDANQRNLLGMLEFSEGNIIAASATFERACCSTKFIYADMVRNWLESKRAIDAGSVIPELRVMILKYPESSALVQALVDEFGSDASEETYQQIFDVLRQFPSRYQFWVLFADLHMLHDFINGGRSPNAGVEFTEEAALVKYGLAMFPRSPELLLLRGIHAIIYGDTKCAAYYSDIAHRHRSIDLGVIAGKYYDHLAQMVASSGATVDSDYARHSCLPNAEFHNAANYQATYSMIQQSAGADWSRVLNISSSAPHNFNELIPTTVFTLPPPDGTAATWHLPSLQIGCNRADICALPGFLIADAMVAASTHFLTQAHDLHMVDDASVGLVYSSHTLEHLSHTLPPPSCASYPRPDASVRGCDSEVGASLAEWRRVLAPGGRLFVSVPDVKVLLGAIAHPLTDAQDKWYYMRYMFGGQIDQYDFHKTGFYEDMLERLLRARGFCNVTRVPLFSVFKDASWNSDKISLSILAVAC